MADAAVQIEIPNRALFKAAEVCDLLHVQPYVLRSWEAEFPGLGVSKSQGSPRLYRRADVERVIKIRHLLLVEGLTLAGVRRRLDEEESPIGADEAAIDELIGRNARERLTAVKHGLRSLLDLLAGNGGSEFRSVVAGSSRSSPAKRSKPTRGKATRARRKR